MKRLISVLLAACMLIGIISVMPVSASAESAVSAVTVYFSDTLGWGDVNVYYRNGGPDWLSTPMEQDSVNENNQQIYKVEIPFDVDEIFFNGNDYQTVIIETDIADGNAWYVTGEMDGGRFTVERYDMAEPASETPTEEAATEPETTVTATESAPSLNGVVDGFYYENGALAKGKGLVEFDGDIYFVKNDGSVYKSGTLKVVADKTNGLLPAGNYKFDAEGKLVTEPSTETAAEPDPSLNGVVDGFYYENGALAKGKGLVEFEGDIYFVKNDGSVYKSGTLKVVADKTNGLLPAGNYKFDAEGKLVTEPATEPVTEEPTEPVTEPETEPVNEEPTEPETEPETTPETEPAPVEAGGYYIAGTMNNWAPAPEFKLTENDAAETVEYVFEGLELTNTDRFKIAYSADGVSFEDADWYPGGMDNSYGANGEITADGTYTVYFRPNSDGGEDWFCNCIYIVINEVPVTEPVTEEPTEPETEPETEPVTEEPTEPETEHATEPVTEEPTELVTEPETEPVTEEPTEPETEPATEPVTEEPTEPETTPETEPAPVEAGGYYIAGTMNNWAPAPEFKLTENDAAETVEYVFEGLELTTSDRFKIAYSADGISFEDADWYPGGMDNSYGANGEITADGTYTVYFRPNSDGGEDWFCNCIYIVINEVPVTEPVTEEPTEPETEPETEPVTEEPTEPETEPATEPVTEEPTEPETTPETEPAPVEAGGYYIAGTMNNWAPAPEFKLTENDAAETVEYVFEGLELTTADQFKIAYSADGVSFEDADWYPGGMDNSYGANGEITADGTYTVYFRPNGDGGEDWFCNCIYIVINEVPVTEPVTEEPTEPETEPETEPVTEEPTEPETEPATEPVTEEPTEPAPLLNGLVDGFYYENGELAKGKGLVEFEGDIYFVKNNGSVYKSGTLKVTSDKTNGLLPAGSYNFNAEGKLVTGGVINGYYYVNGEKAMGAGVIEYNGNFYYVKNNAAVYTSGRLSIPEDKTNGLLPAAAYNIDENGKILCDGLINGYFYISGDKAKGAGVVEYGKNLYFVKNDGTFYKNGTLTIKEEKTNGLVAAGVYNFDKDGKMQDVKKIVNGYYYLNGNKVPGAGVIMYNGDLYFVKNNGAIYTNGRLGISAEKTNGFIPAGYYSFDNNGKMINIALYINSTSHYDINYEITVNPTITTDTNNFLASTGDKSDRSGDIAAMLNKTGSCTLGSGEFFVKGVNMPKYSMIRGQGNSTHVYWVDEDDSPNYIFKLDTGCSLEDMWIRQYKKSGSDPVTAVQSEVRDFCAVEFSGIYTLDNPVNGPFSSTLSNLRITDIEGSGIKLRRSGTGVTAHVAAVNCFIQRCDCGILDDVISEFHQFTNMTCTNCYYGVICRGGNNTYNNCNFSSNYVGVFLDNSDGQSYNNGHGIFNACVIDHSKPDNSGISLMCVGINTGMKFVGCTMGYGNVIIKNSIGIRFFSTGISIATITIENSQGTIFSNMGFGEPSKISINEIDSINTRFIDCYYIDGSEFVR